MSETITYIQKGELERFVKDVFHTVGLSDEHSKTVAKHLVLANLRGVESHGVTRVKNYTRRLESGIVNKEHQMKIVKETPSSALIDGANQLGIIPATEGMQLAVKKAKETGIAAVGINNSNHCGMLADYTSYAAKNECVAMATTNAPSNMAPWGGMERYFGTNPFSYAVPTGNENNIVFDMATSVVARGKIRLAVKNQQDIPLGWAITKDGEQTTDPQKALEGGVLPVGGSKGYGLAFFVEVLSGLLTGAGFGANLGRLDNLDEVQNVGQFFFVMRGDIFLDMDTFKQRIDLMMKEIKSIPLAKGFDRIYIPGEIEAEKAKERSEIGIPLSDGLIKELKYVGQHFSCDGNF